MDDRALQEHDSQRIPWLFSLTLLVIFVLGILGVSAHFEFVPGIFVSVVALVMSLVACIFVCSSDEKPENDQPGRAASQQVPRSELPMNIEWEWTGTAVTTRASDPERSEATAPPELSRQISLPPSYETVVGANAPGEGGIEPPGWRLASLLPH